MVQYDQIKKRGDRHFDHTVTIVGGFGSCENAKSGAQAYMEGWTYAVTNMGVDEAVVTHKQDTNALFFKAFFCFFCHIV